MKLRNAAVVGALLTPLAAMAEAPAVTTTVTEIGTYAAPVTAIGLAVLAIVLVVKGIGWFKRAL